MAGTRERALRRAMKGLGAWLALITAGLIFQPAPIGATSSQAATDAVLILDGTVSGGASSIEGAEAAAQGLRVDVVDAATWSAMTAEQFGSYRAIILGDPTCSNMTPDIEAAAANAGTWGSAIDGNIIVNGTDPVFHASQGGATLTQRAVDFAVAQPGKTGAYISLSCYYHDTAPNTAVPLLDGIGGGGFTVTGVGCYNNAHIVAESPALTGLTDADLSNWGCSVHEGFQTWPGGLIPLAIARDFDSSFTASDGSQGPPYILAGGDIRSFPLSLSPLTDSAPAGGSHTVTAQLLDASTRAPVPGTRIGFNVVSGPSADVDGTCDPASCQTDSAGRVTWTYSNDSGGDDVIEAFVDANGNGSADAGEARTTAGMHWTGSAGFKYVALGDSFSAGEGVEPFFERRNRCHRSRRAYPTLVEEPGLEGFPIRELARVGFPGVEWGFQACSGAWTDDVLRTGQWGDPLAQLAVDRQADTGNANDLPVDADTDLVTISIGGNDARFSDVLNFCATSDNCTTENYQGRSLAQYNREQRDMLSPRLDEVYRQIHTQAPDARILVLGYPQLFPASSAEQNCWKIGQRRVIWRENGRIVRRSIGFSRTEQNYLRQAASELNQLIAARVEASGVATFVPVDRYFAGHEVCGNSSEWINAPSLSRPRDRLITVNDQAFHPNERGHRHGYAAAVNDVLNPG